MLSVVSISRSYASLPKRVLAIYSSFCFALYDCIVAFCFAKMLRSSPRAISTGQLHTLLHFHLRPINLVVFQDPYQLNAVGNLILKGASRLDAFSVYPVRT